MEFSPAPQPSPEQERDQSVVPVKRFMRSSGEMLSVSSSPDGLIFESDDYGFVISRADANRYGQSQFPPEHPMHHGPIDSNDEDTRSVIDYAAAQVLERAIRELDASGVEVGPSMDFQPLTDKADQIIAEQQADRQ